MQIALSIGAAGLSASQSMLDVAGANIANIDTTAYKPQESVFSELVHNKMHVSSSSTPLSGSGAGAVATGIDAEGAGMSYTGRSLDLAVDGDGWFALEGPNGKLYTRDGSFDVSVSDGSAYLVNSEGYYVLDSNGQRILTPANGDMAKEENALTDKVGIFTFSVPEALTPISGNCYAENSLSGAATATGEGTVLKGYLEESGVSLTDEMVSLITSQRAYQLSARVVQTADDVAQTISSLRQQKK